MNKKHTTGHITGSNNLWNFTESYQTDRRNLNDELDEDATTAGERAPFMQTMEDRCEAKMTEKKIKLPEELVKFINQDKTEDDEKEAAEEEVKEDATIHYDKEDLISLH